MDFFSRHRFWLYGLGGIVLLYLLYRYYVSAAQGPSASDVASQGTLTPGSTVYADTSGSVGYGVPGQSLTSSYYADPNAALNYSLMSGLLNSGQYSTAPSNQGPVASVANSAALGTGAGVGTVGVGAYSGAGANPNSAASSAITMPDLNSLLPAAIPTGSPGGTLTAASSPAAVSGSTSYGPLTPASYGAVT